MEINTEPYKKHHCKCSLYRFYETGRIDAFKCDKASSIKPQNRFANRDCRELYCLGQFVYDWCKESYHQSHLPVREQREAVGQAVGLYVKISKNSVLKEWL